MRTKNLVVVVMSAILVAVLAVHLAGGLEGCAPAAKTPLRITINSWIGWAPLYLAKEKGLNGGTQVEIIRVEDTGARKSTMISGKVDGYASSVDNFALDAAQGVPGKIVMNHTEVTASLPRRASRGLKTSKESESDTRKVFLPTSSFSRFSREHT
jgi:ABC-type nitrate/sulfonate/bicarbonate transport system substrate-binding protein